MLGCVCDVRRRPLLSAVMFPMLGLEHQRNSSQVRFGAAHTWLLRLWSSQSPLPFPLICWVPAVIQEVLGGCCAPVPLPSSLLADRRIKGIWSSVSLNVKLYLLRLSSLRAHQCSLRSAAGNGHLGFSLWLVSFFQQHGKFRNTKVKWILCFT